MHTFTHRLLQLPSRWLSFFCHTTPSNRSECCSSSHLQVTKTTACYSFTPCTSLVTYKTCCLCFKAISGTAPQYLTELLHVYTPSRTLRSSADTRLLKVQRFSRKQHGARSFACSAPQLWNSLPYSLRHCSTLCTFKQQLKTFLFRQHFTD